MPVPTVSDVVRAIAARVPPGQAAEWDRVGLHVGDGAAEATGVLVALDATPAVVREAVERGCSVLVTHHPLLFRPVGRVTADDPVGGLVLQMARAGVAHVAVHTNLDAAADGVSVALAHQIGLSDVRVLAPLADATRLVVAYVPEGAADAVRGALADAGAGRIGAYSRVSFTSAGTGRFTPEDGAEPTVGTVGTPEEVAEARVEVVVAGWFLSDAITAFKRVHPYEEPVVLAHPVSGVETREGFGAVGTLPEPEALGAFLDRVAHALGAPALRHTGDPARPVQRVAACGGSGLSFLPDALRAGADAYVTADVTYHRWFEALGPDGGPRIALVDA
ncbi:MAG TPA: Nif3-like dinuclear metal center hexameric protein, partial [Rubricoccaceae bacterium]